MKLITECCVYSAHLRDYGVVLIDGQRAGVTPESIKKAAKSNQMSLEEARKILGIDPNAPWDDVLKV